MLATHVHAKDGAGVHEPAIGLDPRIGLLGLEALGEVLMEQAVVVVEAHAVATKTQARDGVHEAGGEAAQTAVAQGGLGLAVLDGGQRGAVLGKHGLGVVEQAQVDEVGAQQAAYQELSGEVIQFAGARSCGHALLHVADCCGKREKEVLVGNLSIPSIGNDTALLQSSLHVVLQIH